MVKLIHSLKCFGPKSLPWERSPWVVRPVGGNRNQIHLLHCCRDSSSFRTFRNWLCVTLVFFHRTTQISSLLMKSPLMDMFLQIPLRMLTILWISEIWGGRTQDFAEWHIKLLLCIAVGLGKSICRTSSSGALRSTAQDKIRGAPFLFIWWYSLLAAV